MSSPLVPCPDCGRHVFAGASAACPFCGVALPDDLRTRAIPAATRRLTRAATYAFTASLTVAACSSGGSGTLGDAGAVDSGRDDGGIAPAYGAPFDAGVAPLYGMPADAGHLDGGGDADDGGPAVLYGLPPSDAGSG